ncbi:alpha/beta hydrolase [Micromonospora sp. NPDC006766]|uniref:alpha/beta hydrolase n=1 Tax=Micromonospora sp. NPDC006766 TaxID=3154778 RepID=UPI0033DCFC8E
MSLFERLDVRPYEELGVLRARRAMAAVTRSQTAPLPVARVEDVTVPGAVGRLPTRVYDPAPGAGLPLVVYVHGGGFSLGNVEAADGPCRRLAETAKVVVASVEYRLAPESPFPAGLEDCRAAVDWLLDDPGRVGAGDGRILVGDSAGAHLVASTSVQRRDAGLRPADAQVLIYPTVRPARGNPFRSYEENADAPLMSRSTMTWFWDQYLPASHDPTDPRIDLLRCPDFRGLPRTLIVAAELDPLRDEGLELAARMAEDGVPVETSLYEGAVHGFWWLDAALGQAAELDGELAAFIGRL